MSSTSLDDDEQVAHARSIFFFPTNARSLVVLQLLEPDCITTNTGENDAVVAYPTQILGIRNHPQIAAIQSGEDHRIAVSRQGQCLTWGRIENDALGFDPQSLPSWATISDAGGRPRIPLEPKVIPSLKNVGFATAGTDEDEIVLSIAC
ncbi:hypothetical protein EYZ11_001087 [Aspergillus tanneri]|nr:hypothetical protein EYZ11_001087 [Aspergillus tanneri]